MMNYFSSKKKWMAYLILLTFVFTCIVPTNLAGGNSAWAEDSTIAYEPATKAESGIEFQLFNYNEYVNLNGVPADGTAVADASYRDWIDYFGFRGADYTYQKAANATVNEDGYTKNHVKVKPVLSTPNGYPVLKGADGSDGYSLKHLFTSGDHAVTAYTNIDNTPLQYNENTGYYEYNSRENAADFIDNAFYVRNYVERTIQTAPYAGYADFLPFNQLSGRLGTNDTTNQDYHYDYQATDSAKKPDYWFGMTMAANFYQPKNGLVNGENMVFSFSGDDDVWVFIDDVLVLDLGGTHGVVTGSINFATGEVKQYIDWAGDTGENKTIKYHWDGVWKNATVSCEGSKDHNNATNTTHSATDTCDAHVCTANCYTKSYPTSLKACFATAGREPNGGWDDNGTPEDTTDDVFKDYTNHTIKFFYLERASSCANCMLVFNLPTLPPDSLTVGKEVPATGNVLIDKLLEGKTYTFRVLESDENGNVVKENDDETPKVLLPAGTSYAIWENNVDTKEIGEVNADGTFTLKAGQQAVFSGMLNYYDDGKKHYVVAEELTGDYKVSVNGTVTANGQTGALATDSAQMIVFENEVNNPASLSITKEIAPDKEADFKDNQEYRFEVTVDGKLLPENTVYKIGTENKAVSEDGVVLIKANETATIEGLLLGTNYTVRELDLTANGTNPTYTVDGTIVDEVKGKIETAGQNVNVIVTNSSTQEYVSVSGEKTWVDNNDELDKRPDEITLYLFRDGAEMQGVTTTTSLDMNWKYSFDNLPRYATNATVTGEEKADGHEYEYLVAEKKLDNYAPTYKAPVKDADGNVTIDITNTYGEPETETSIQVTKIWDDNNDELGKRPQSITLNLFNGVDKDPICTTTASYDYTFINLPIYDDATGKPYVYTVTENDVDHYLSAIVPTADGFKITNTLYTGQAGQFTVNKQVEGELQPPENSEYDFNLQIKAEVVNWDAVLVSKKMELEKAHDEAYKALNGSDEDGINGATKDAQDATDEFIKNAKLTTPSAYQFVLLDGPEALFAVDRSSPSAYIWESASEVTIDPNADKGIVETVAKAIKELAQKFSNLFDKPAVFMQLLHEKVEVTTPSAVVFDKAEAVKLFNAEKARIAAVELEASTKLALQNFKTDIATPSAITLKLSPSSAKLEEKTITLTPGESPLDGEGFYTVPFKLFKDTGYTFIVEATTGASIEYKISEIKWPTENYETTNIDVMNDAGKTTLSDKRFAGPYELTAKQANTFIFHNVYKTPEEPPYVPPTTEKKDPPPPPEKNNPDTTIPDENIPTGSVEPGEPLDELEDPEIPLGDAPATGDTNNAAPFMALLLVAIVGLAITRRKFN